MTKPLQMVRRWWHHEQPAIAPPAHPPAAVHSVDSPPPPYQAALATAGIPATLVYPSTTLSHLLDQTADRFNASTALVYNDRKWTYRDLLADVNRIAGGLAHLGVRRRDRVLLALPNCPEFVAGFFAIQKLGAVVVNAGPLMGADDIERVTAITTPQVAIGLDLRAPVLAHAARKSAIEHWVWVSLEPYQSTLDRLGYRVKRWYGGNGFHGAATHIGLADLMAEAHPLALMAEPSQSDVAVLQPTGGTTGTLKLAQLTHRNLLANAMQVSVCMGSMPGQDRILALLPMFHVYALTTCLISGILIGGEIILLTRFNAEQTLDCLRKYRPTIFPLVPAICDALSDAIERLDRPIEPMTDLRLCLSGAAPLPRETAERFKKNTGALVLEGYGLTEASPVTHANLAHLHRDGTIGVPMPDTLCRIVAVDDSDHECGIDEPGELLIHGPQVMAGYFGDPEQNHGVLTTDEQGRAWLHTGDIAATDKDGFFHIIDRKKDMIIRSGMKVFPSKVERLLLTHPQVKEAAVFGRADPVHTEMVIAAIVLREPAEHPAALASQLKALCRSHLAPYEVPCAIEFMNAIPRTPLGKVRKSVLRNGTASQTPAAINEDPATDEDPANEIKSTETHREEAA